MTRLHGIMFHKYCSNKIVICATIASIPNRHTNFLILNFHNQFHFVFLCRCHRAADGNEVKPGLTFNHGSIIYPWYQVGSSPLNTNIIFIHSLTDPTHTNAHTHILIYV